DGRAARVLHAAMQTIDERDLKGLAEPVLAALPVCKEEYLQQAARKALQATSRPEDVELLLRALASEHRQTRIAGIETLPRVIGVKAVADLQPLLEDKDDFVSITAAVALANLGER